jgi:hypothetical protein
VFTTGSFADIGTPRAILHALGRHAAIGQIRRLARGVYDYPKQHPVLGPLSPSPDDVAKALQSRDATRLSPAGAYAANLLGLSEQVPATIEYVTDGGARSVTIGNQTIKLRHKSTRFMGAAGRPAGLVIHALSHLGRDNVDGDVIARRRRRFDADTRRAMLRDAKYAPAWIAKIFHHLAEDTHHD